MNPSVNSSCPLCKSTKLNNKTIFYKKHKLLICKNCGFVFMEIIPDTQTLINYYANYSYQVEKEIPAATRISYNKLLDKLEKYRKNNILIDYGCGRGWFLKEAQKRGWNVIGIEISEKAIELNKKNGISVFHSLQEINPEYLGKVDVITSFEVIEHFANPHEFISQSYIYLRKNGLFYITTPNFNKTLLRIHLNNHHYICYPEHLSYFSVKTLNYLFDMYRFKKHKILTTGIPLVFTKASSPLTNNDYTIEEKVQTILTQHKFMLFLKNTANFLLSALRLGVSIKAYFIKQ